MKYTIDEIMEMLSSDDEYIQEKGIIAASEVKNLKCFMQPEYMEYGRRTWDNCAAIISKRTDDEIKDYIIDMLIWVEDINCWGAVEILDRLIAYKDKKHLEDCILRMVNYNMKESMKEQLNELIKRASLNVVI